MHPIEHLRYVARSRGGDAAELAREAATAIGTMYGPGPDLVVACRRIVERHPEAGPLWWMGARLLTADDPSELAWQLAEELADDPTARRVAAALPDDATVLTIGWPAVGGEALMRRGDSHVLCADSRFEASSFMQRLERVGVGCDPVPAESLARAAAAADIVLVEGLAASPERILAAVGSHVVAAVAQSVGTPVWCVLGRGRRLPVGYVDAMASRVVCADGWDGDVDDLPVGLVSHVATAQGVGPVDGASLAAECPYAPELLRTGIA